MLRTVATAVAADMAHLDGGHDAAMQPSNVQHVKHCSVTVYVSDAWFTGMLSGLLIADELTVGVEVGVHGCMFGH